MKKLIMVACCLFLVACGSKATRNAMRDAAPNWEVSSSISSVSNEEYEDQIKSLKTYLDQPSYSEQNQTNSQLELLNRNVTRILINNVK